MMQHGDHDVDEAQQRVRRYWYEDGLTEIAAGCLFILVGGLFFAEVFAPAGSLPPNFTAIGLLILIIIGVWLAGRVVAAIKERLTYPRTGYVSYHRPSPTSRLVSLLVALVTGALAVILFRLVAVSEDFIQALLGIAVGVYLLYLAHTLGLTRFYVLALVSGVIGAGVALGSMSEELGTAVYYSLMGLALIASGGLTLRSYLSRTSRIEGD